MFLGQNKKRMKVLLNIYNQKKIWMEEQEYEGGLHNKIFWSLSQLLDMNQFSDLELNDLSQSLRNLVIPSVFSPKEPMDIYLGDCKPREHKCPDIWGLQDIGS